MTFLAKKKQNTDFWGTPNPVRIMVLVVGLLLATMILVFMTATVSSLIGISQSVGDLRVGLTDVRHAIDTKATPTEPGAVTPTPEPVKAMPPVIFSVTQYGPGEQVTLQSNLVLPLLSYYSSSTGTPLSVVLIERKNAVSHNVNVRLFFVDGTETDYLWPSMHSANGMWTSAAQ